jgi:hypothetical protein
MAVYLPCGAGVSLWADGGKTGIWTKLIKRRDKSLMPNNNFRKVQAEQLEKTLSL